MTKFKDRLSSLLAAKNLTYTQLASAIGVSRQGVQTWAAGRSVPTGKNLYRLADFFGVSADWLKTGEHPDADDVGEPVGQVPTFDKLSDDDFVYVPEYGLTFGAGDREAPTLTQLEQRGSAVYRRSFFQSRQINPQKARRATVEGDSMEPLLWDGDKILFEENPGCPIKDGAVYAMSYGGSMRVKRLFRKENGDLILHSDNPRYPDETISGDELELVRIYGRVIDKSGNGGL